MRIIAAILCVVLLTHAAAHAGANDVEDHDFNFPCVADLSSDHDVIAEFLAFLKTDSFGSESQMMGLPDPRQARFPLEFAESLRGAERPVLSDGPAPVGVDSENFKNLLDIIAKDVEFRDIGGVIIFGSRTHFSYGTVPHGDSDLDIIAFGLPDRDVFDRANRALVATLERRLTRALLGIKVANLPMMEKELFPPTRSLEWHIDTLLNDLTLPQSRERWDKFFSSEALATAEKLSRPGYEINDSRKALKNHWMNHSDEVINKEAIFVVKASRVNEADLKALREMHYQNVIVLNDER